MAQCKMGRLMENDVRLLFFSPSEDVEREHDDVFPSDERLRDVAPFFGRFWHENKALFVKPIHDIFGDTGQNLRHKIPKLADDRRREKSQSEYVDDFYGAVLAFLDFHLDHADLSQ